MRPVFPSLDLRSKTMIAIMVSLFFITAIVIAATLCGDRGLVSHLGSRHLAPCWQHPFGTDWLGRDMLARTLLGLRTSLGIGLAAATISALIALILGLASATLGRLVDTVITFMVDAMMSTPHLVLLLLIAFTCGGGTRGIILAVACTHWPSLTRIIRAEVLQLKTADYIHLSRKLGKTPWFIARYHLLPHVAPQFLIGLLLLFPHAILHAAALTFLGVGMSPHLPEIGALLAESMRYLSMGYWWLAIAPGAALIFTVKLFDILSTRVSRLIDPKTCRE
ncbi:MAG: peptide ABC transporter permease [Deltaproteobacteria bacterium]|nr:MAG: peptide ABC transporter permease [Deltaproteobacteria bacterium]